tara:strand:- start:1810 stop:2682 length:873 start_codon:yes stop_codon:yes gene_type:complete
MINLWYEESYWGYKNGTLSGPEEVVRNTVLALEQENIPYAINEQKYSHNFLVQYQHDVAHKKHEKLEHDSCVIGPQFWPYDGSYGKFLIDNPEYYRKLIAPSYWVEDMLVNKFNIPNNKVSIWAAPIPDLSNYKKTPEIDCLIYFKSRQDSDLKSAKELLESKNLSYQVLQYGNYSEDDFIGLVEKSKFCFLIDSTESQGIAIQKIMSTNTPLFVWDVSEWDYMGEQYKVSASSVPYWSKDCGEKFYDLSEMNDVFEKFYDNIDNYNPKELIDSELSYKVSIEKLLNCFV